MEILNMNTFTVQYSQLEILLCTDCEQNIILKDV